MFDTLFNNNISELLGSDFYQSIPNANLELTDDGYEYILACPGLEKSDINVKIENNYLVISTDKSKQETKNYKRKEFDYTNFKRSFSLPSDLNVSSLKAIYENGMLKLKADRINQEIEVNQIYIS
jgi:HSP20 family protein